MIKETKILKQSFKNKVIHYQQLISKNIDSSKINNKFFRFFEPNTTKFLLVFL